MALNEARRWLIAYDVCEPRRLARVHRLLTRAAVPVQYSVFVTSGSQAQLRQLAQQISALIDPAADDVRMYPIPQQPWFYTIGRSMLPAEAMLLDSRTRLQALLAPDPGKDGAAPSSDDAASAAPKPGPSATASANPRSNSEMAAVQRSSQP